VQFWKVYDLYQPFKVHLWPMVKCVPTFLGMYLVVAFGSSLDVAAIQMDLGKPLDINRELMVVGAANTLSGFTGGFTGSYIFSQTIFLMRAGVDNRLATWFATVLQFLFFLMPTSPLPYVPNFFFGALLVFIMLDLSVDWLWHARRKLSLLEYGNLWAALALIIVFDLELGMLLGCLVCALGFVFTYARMTSFEFVEGRARVVRSRYHAAVLSHAQQTHALSCIQLNGYIFFGSSTAIVDQVRLALDNFDEGIEDPDQELQNPQHHFLRPELYTRWRQHIVLDFSRAIGLDATAARSFAELRHLCAAHDAILIFAGMSPAVQSLLKNHGALDGADVHSFTSTNEALKWSEQEHLTGYDQSVMPLDVVCGTVPTIVDILSYFLDLDVDRHPASPRSNPMGRFPTCDAQLRAELANGKEIIAAHFKKQVLRCGEVLFRKGDLSRGMWFVGDGQVSLTATESTTAPGPLNNRQKRPSIVRRMTLGSRNLESITVSSNSLNNMDSSSVGDASASGNGSALSLRDSAKQEGADADAGSDLITLQFGVGAAVGDMDFMLDQRRSYSACVTSDTATLYMLSGGALEQMLAEAPKLAAVVHAVMLKSTYRSTAQFFEGYNL